MSGLSTRGLLDQWKLEAAELVRLGAWTQAQADRALDLMKRNPALFDDMTSTEALDMARDMTP